MYQDILTNADGTPQVVNSDFVVGASDGQHIQDILLSRKGDWKEHPLCGVAMFSFINGPDDEMSKLRLKRSIRLNLEADGYKINKLTVKQITNPIIEVQ